MATAHGKGPSYGLGGTLKRLATKASLQGIQIQSAKELQTWAENNIGIRTTFISSQECIAEKNFLKERFKEAVSISGIRSFHSIIVSEQGSVYLKVTSSSEQLKSLNL